MYGKTVNHLCMSGEEITVNRTMCRLLFFISVDVNHSISFVKIDNSQLVPKLVRLCGNICNVDFFSMKLYCHKTFPCHHSKVANSD